MPHRWPEDINREQQSLLPTTQAHHEIVGQVQNKQKEVFFQAACN